MPVPSLVVDVDRSSDSREALAYSLDRPAYTRWSEWLPIELSVIDAPDIELTLRGDREGCLSAGDVSHVFLCHAFDKCW